ncbi:acetyl-CoA C-acyltransferase [Methylocystis sp. MJC1]|jgi:acetyl-CoA C-acetyltransferase|uniref:acetyl-CoA C-acyltransferase n=1 Tax=Methylocystis sp. MJC1 TaxID=2654282 RepID=UPI0013EAA2FB|nr:acetyl-CoA C-acyltransferase [Methylocystis sp. MJC1]KAF2989838.1 Acetyl-CoA acetyltransferase [Methylocystis sp. MJC1]MBU6528395.1 acetyl-CoA C-acyltransferase [Methylocystis sp. MJC1]UZX11296.1 acetyl-CoA C-acyltransferase [Methylocystis sp. MJC1]
MKDQVVIVGAARTPIGAFLGELAHVAAPQLGARAIDAAVTRAVTPKDQIDSCVMGCVLSAGLGQAPARQAALGAGLGVETGCVTVNKMCGSGMQALISVHDQLLAESTDLAVAGGMESMSNAPYLLDRARSGFRMGHGRAIDHMFFDGLEDAYEKGRLMGSFAEDCATDYQFTRKMQDEFALRSLSRAQNAAREGLFDEEITPVAPRKNEAPIVRDELPQKANAEAIEKLRPAFRPDGTLTAANSSAISDGAAALALTRLKEAERRGLTPHARLVGHVTHAGPPGKFPTAPIAAIRKLLDKVAWRAEDVDLYEINEAFAVVTMAAMRDLALPDEKVNIHGGACALGHPIGASGARIVVTLLSALEHYGLRKGVAALCIGGGEATAVAIERCF